MYSFESKRRQLSYFDFHSKDMSMIQPRPNSKHHFVICHNQELILLWAAIGHSSTHVARLDSHRTWRKRIDYYFAYRCRLRNWWYACFQGCMDRQLGWVGWLISLIQSSCVNHYLEALGLFKITDVRKNFLLSSRAIENYNAEICLIEPNLHCYSLMLSQIEINYLRGKWTG